MVRSVTRHLPWIAAAALFVGCAAAPAPKPQPAADSGDYLAAVPTRTDQLSLEQAEAMVAAFQVKHGGAADNDPLRTPASQADALTILKRDQIDLFPAAAAFLAGQSDPQSQALHAQIQLAWGEGCVVLADLLWDHAARTRPRVQRLEMTEAAGALDEAGKASLAAMRDSVQEATGAATALMRVAAEHLRAGVELAHQVIRAMPDDYVGYRVAGDYHRLRQDWLAFDATIAKLEALNPESNGLAFLRGVSAAERDGDTAAAREHLRAALTRDPAFVRAQAQLVLWADEVADQHAELLRLEALNPQHQIVRWAGPKIKEAFPPTPAAQPPAVETPAEAQAESSAAAAP